jgi:hypothetical protein
MYYNGYYIPKFDDKGQPNTMQSMPELEVHTRLKYRCAAPSITATLCSSPVKRAQPHWSGAENLTRLAEQFFINFRATQIYTKAVSHLSNYRPWIPIRVRSHQRSRMITTMQIDQYLNNLSRAPDPQALAEHFSFIDHYNWTARRLGSWKCWRLVLTARSTALLDM